MLRWLKGVLLPVLIISLIQPPSTINPSPHSSLFLDVFIFPILLPRFPDSLSFRCPIYLLSFLPSLKKTFLTASAFFSFSRFIGCCYRVQVLIILSKSSILRI